MLTMMLFPHFGTWYIAQALELCRMEPSEKQLDMYTIKKERKHVACFVKEFLKNDGVFVIRMVGMHAGILFTSELTSELFGHFFRFIFYFFYLVIEFIQIY
ncbi:unnamed protein product [Meloidogyne enterolobii]|uniref:Uncharacterized protein n=1 Tax=Meloidogyne enterolobii TaxID=390850 RepID=A0ACB0YCL8_MELEN